MKKKRLGNMALSAAFLISCTQNSTSSEDASEMDVSSNDSSSLENADSSSVSSSSIDDGSLSFEEAYNEIAKAQKSELNNAQSVIYHNESSSATIKNKINQTYTNYEDGSTTSEGTYTYSVEGKEDQVDTFKTISTSTVDKYENGDDFDSYRMFVEVTDFDKDLGVTDNYQDSASKKFIINSEEDVGNLNAGEYILAKDFEANAAANLTSKLANFLAGDIMGNDYVIQTGLNKVKPTQKETGEWEYLIQFEYSSKDDGITTTYLTKAQYTLSQDKSQLLSFNTLNKTTYAREGEESAYSLYEESGEIIYGDKAKEMGNDVLNVDNYFLTDVLSVRLEAVAGFKTITVGDDLTIKLIDYDSLYIPCKEFENKIEEIKGLPDYQHPCRMQNKYANSKVDYFSELIIYLSLTALVENPNLWNKYNIANKDYSLLFDQSDYSDLRSSAIYSDLNTLSEEVRSLLAVLEKYLSCNDINKLNPFDEEAQIKSPLIESLFCINCGKEFVAKEDLYCIHCGTKRV